MKQLGSFAKNIFDKAKARTFGDSPSESSKRLARTLNLMPLSKKHWALFHSHFLFGST